MLSKTLLNHLLLCRCICVSLSSFSLDRWFSFASWQKKNSPRIKKVHTWISWLALLARHLCWPFSFSSFCSNDKNPKSSTWSIVASGKLLYFGSWANQLINMLRIECWSKSAVFADAVADAPFYENTFLLLFYDLQRKHMKILKLWITPKKNLCKTTICRRYTYGPFFFYPT
jgi:hypothetical protein